MAFDEDKSLFLDPDDFAEEITLQGESIDAIFEYAWTEVTLGGVPYSGERPTLYGDSDDFQDHHNDTVKIQDSDGNLNSYKILDIQPDGVGFVRVILQEL